MNYAHIETPTFHSGRKYYCMVEISILAMFGKIAQNILSVRNHSPNWQQFPHVRHKTIFKLVFKKVPKLGKVGVPHFQTKKGILALDNDWVNSWIWIIKY